MEKGLLIQDTVQIEAFLKARFLIVGQMIK